VLINTLIAHLIYNPATRIQGEKDRQKAVQVLHAQRRLHLAEHRPVRVRPTAHAQVLPHHLLWSTIGNPARGLGLAASHPVAALRHDVGAAHFHALQDCELSVVRGHSQCRLSREEGPPTADSRHQQTGGRLPVQYGGADAVPGPEHAG